MNDFSVRLKKAMQERGMTAAELSKQSKIGKSSISEWLNGKYEAKQDKVYILANVLNVDEGWLMGLDVPMEKQQSESLLKLYTQLEKPRQQKVYNYADQQLKEQNGEIEQDNILIAAHSKEDLTDDERQQINDFIDKIRKEKGK